MNAPEGGPLWRQVLGDEEPQRQGRQAVIVVSLLILLGEAGIIFATLLAGDPREFFIQLLVGWLVTLLLYFVWIGQTWARWILAPVFLIDGGWNSVWGIVNGDGLRIVFGIGELTVFVYLVISPSVYSFARAQRERINRWQVMAISAVFFLTLVSVGSGIFAFFNYQNALKAEARDFAVMTLHRVFENRDPQYLAAHSSKKRRFMSAQGFINQMNADLGEIKEAGPVGTTYRIKFVPYELQVHATARARIIFERAPMWVTVEVSRQHEEWEIDRISWDY